MGRIYTIPYAGTLTNAGGNADLLELLPADDKPTKLLGWIIGAYSDQGDANAESLNINLIRMNATITSGSGGSAVTPVPFNDLVFTTAYGGTAECNNSTVATTSGTATTMMELAWVIQASPWEFWFPEPKLTPCVRQGEGLFFRCATTVADDISIAMTFFIEEE